MQGDPADSVFFIEGGQCQVGYNQRRTADEDLVSVVSCLRTALSQACSPKLVLIALSYTEAASCPAPCLKFAPCPVL